MTRSSVLLSKACNDAKPAPIAIETKKLSHTWVMNRATKLTTPRTATTIPSSTVTPATATKTIKKMTRENGWKIRLRKRTAKTAMAFWASLVVASETLEGKLSAVGSKNSPHGRRVAIADWPASLNWDVSPVVSPDIGESLGRSKGKMYQSPVDGHQFCFQNTTHNILRLVHNSDIINKTILDQTNPNIFIQNRGINSQPQIPNFSILKLMKSNITLNH
ncbi:hypothetical protein G4B88_003121 [Cannabis sativa]|uniref:Uncharacterized protein n=1 Tax=Cannabis sativa TaxID=3483 RepID=A0A7J6H383_CANSA|nr:hypothetical protein G4B88_003121 [Cannabis sativa]